MTVSNYWSLKKGKKKTYIMVNKPWIYNLMSFICYLPNGLRRKPTLMQSLFVSGLGYVVKIQLLYVSTVPNQFLSY